MTPRLRIALALSWRGVAILAVAGALAAVWLGLTDPDPSAPDSTARMGGQAAPGWVLPPPTAASDLADLLARPLFDPTRRPWQESGSAAEPVQAAQDWVLVATIVGTGRASAILRPAGGGNVSVQIGTVLNGWTVQSIARGSVSLERDGIRRQVTARKAKE